MLDRPSQRKVVGVANRYIAYHEAMHSLDVERFRMKNEELDMFEAQRVGYLIGMGLAKEILGAPLQAWRRLVLWDAQQAEGFAPGEENIARFALRLCSDPERYPQAQRALSETKEN